MAILAIHAESFHDAITWKRLCAQFSNEMYRVTRERLRFDAMSATIHPAGAFTIESREAQADSAPREGNL